MRSADSVSGAPSHPVSALGGALASTIGLLCVVLMWRDAFDYQVESGEGNALVLALLATGVVAACWIPLVVPMANPTSRPHYRWMWAALVVGTSVAGAALMSAAINGSPWCTRRSWACRSSAGTP